MVWRKMDLLVVEIVAITFSILVLLAVLILLTYVYVIRRRMTQQSVKSDKNRKKAKEGFIRHRPARLKLNEIRYQRVASQCTGTPLVITPTTPTQFTIPPSRLLKEEGRFGLPTKSTEFTKGMISPSAMPGKVCPGLGQNSPKLLRTMSEGDSAMVFNTAGRTPPHGNIEFFLEYDEEDNCLSVQILGNKGHSLSWLPTGISNPYIRVTLISCNTGDGENVRSSSSKVLNLPSNSRCKLAGIAEKNLKDCLLKLVVLEFDRFSRSEFVAEVLVPLGDLGDLREGVRICQELMLQQKVMITPRGSLLISLCNQSVAQQLQVVIMKADGIPSKSSVSLVGFDLCVKITLETSDACQTRKTKGFRKNNSYIFNEKLVFEVNSDMLADAMLMFEVSRGDSKLRHESKVGFVKLGLDSSQALEMRHWSEMLASPQKQIAEWHYLRRV